MSLHELQGIMDSFPTLTSFGFGVIASVPGNQIDEEMKKYRQEMLEPSSVASYEKAKEWFRSKTKLKHVSRRLASYSLKHVAEKDMKCYISNGMFIAAALAEGFTIQRATADSPNAYINIKKKGN